MAAGRYLFISFLRTKVQIGQAKNRSSEKLHNKDRQVYYNCYKIRWRAIKYLKLRFQTLSHSIFTTNELSNEERKL